MRYVLTITLVIAIEKKHVIVSVNTNVLAVCILRGTFFRVGTVCCYAFRGSCLAQVVVIAVVTLPFPPLLWVNVCSQWSDGCQSTNVLPVETNKRNGLSS